MMFLLYINDINACLDFFIIEATYLQMIVSYIRRIIKSDIIYSQTLM